MESEKRIELERDLQLAISERAILKNKQEKISRKLWETNMRISRLMTEIANEQSLFKTGDIVRYSDNGQPNPFRGRLQVVNISASVCDDGSRKILITFWKIKPNGEDYYKRLKNNWFSTYYIIRQDGSIEWERENVKCNKIN